MTINKDKGRRRTRIFLGQGRVHKISAQLLSILLPKNQLAGLGSTVSQRVRVPGHSPSKFLKFDTFKHFRSSVLRILVVVEKCQMFSWESLNFIGAENRNENCIKHQNNNYEYIL